MVCFCDVYFWRQSMVLLNNCAHSVGTGLVAAFPSVLNPDILSSNSTKFGIHATSDQASWIASSNGISGLIGFCVAPYVMQTYGRRAVNIGLNFFFALGFLIFALANNISCLYAARIIQGVSMTSVYIGPLLMGEYVHPKRRGYFVSIKKTMVPIGSLLCHSLGMIWTWKQIAAFATIPYIVTIISTFTWLESPSFLAMTGQYEKCMQSHKRLFGDSVKRKRELQQLISSQMEARDKTNDKQYLKEIIRKFQKKEFIKPCIIASLLTMVIDACGRYYMLAYVVQILTEVTKDKSIAVYCSVGSDILTYVALLTSIFVIRCFKRRTLLFSSGIVCVILMCLTSLLTTLKTRYNIGESIFWWSAPLVILSNVFIVNVGLVPVSFTIMSEIFPLEHKGTGLCVLGLVFTTLFFVVMKFTPLMMEKMGIEGTFGIYALFVAVGLFILYFILNETKDKTLQEIENDFRGEKRFKLNEDGVNEKPLLQS